MMDQLSTEIDPRELKLRKRFRGDFFYYAPRVLKILTKPTERGMREIKPFRFNSAQKHLHQRIEDMIERKGFVRLIILKGRQQGISTYVEGRGYWKVSQRKGEQVFILTHEAKASQNLLGMAQRYHEHATPSVRPQHGRNNNKEITFPKLDSAYRVATAGAKDTGRSATATFFHGSEVGFWDNGDIHLAGILQTIPLAPGTEVYLESTANGLGNIFHKHWQQAERGESDFEPVFIPWFWQEEYSRKAPDDYEPSVDKGDVPDGEPTEAEFMELFNLTREQMYWRKMKIAELGGGDSGYFMFKQEYPATPDEAFQQSGGESFITRASVLKARKATIATPGPLIIGVDPAGQGKDRFSIIRRRTRRLFNPTSHSKLTNPQAVALLLGIIKAEKPARMFIDVGGLGIGVYEQLIQYSIAQGVVFPVNFGSTANDPEKYVDRKAEMAFALKEWLEDPIGANIEDSDELQADLLSVREDYPDANQRRRIKSKKWMKQQGLRSPDLFDAAGLTFAEPVEFMTSTAGQTTSVTADFDPFTGDQYNQSTFQDFDPTDF